MLKTKVWSGETVTYWLEIPEDNYLGIVELEEEVVIGTELKEELWVGLPGGIGLSGHQRGMEARCDFKLHSLKKNNGTTVYQVYREM